MSQYAEHDFTFGDVFSETKARALDTQYRMAAERARPLGGIPEVGVTSESYVDAPGVIVVPIGFLTVAQLHVMSLVSGGTGSVRLVDLGAVASVAITSSSVASPSVITTAAAHGLETGDVVTITGHSGSTPDINGSHTVTVLSSTTFSIPVNVTTGGTGGTVQRTSSRAVASSEMTFTATSPTLLESPDLMLVAGASYKMQTKISVSTEYAIVYGGALVTQ